MRFRPSPWLSLFSVIGLGILIGLGSWQLDRREWKLDLIATIEARIQAPPLGAIAPGDVAPAKIGLLEYRRTKVDGTLYPDKELYLHAIGPNGAAGVHVISPVETKGGIVLLNRGFVPVALKDPAKRAAGQIQSVSLNGVIRNDQNPGFFTPSNDPAGNAWFYRDSAAMARALGYDLGEVLPFVVEADATPNPGGWPLGGQTRVEIKNDHLQYALTWFGLALTLVGVYLAFSIKRD